MKHILFIVVLFAFSFSGLRAQDHIPQAKKPAYIRNYQVKSRVITKLS